MSDVIPLVRWGEPINSAKDALRTLDALIQGKDIKSCIIIAIDGEGYVISSGYGYDENPFTIVGALEMMKREVMGNIE